MLSREAIQLRNLKLHISILLVLSLCTPAFADESAHDEPYLEAFGLGVLCLTVGLPTCALFSSREKNYLRPASEWGGSISYLPGYVASPDHGAGFQRVEATGYISNLAMMLEHRRGFQNFNGFYSSSFRLAYSFDYGDTMPGIGVGFRNVIGGRNTKAFELWLPLYRSPKRPRQDGRENTDIVTLSTIWVFGDNRISPEGVLQMSHRIANGIFLTGTGGYFSDYPNPDLEISVGPTIFF